MSDDVLALMMKELAARREMGLKTYGRTLAAFNKRNAVQDALEEALDLAAYLTQLRCEQEVVRNNINFHFDVYKMVSGISVEQRHLLDEMKDKILALVELTKGGQDEKEDCKEGKNCQENA